MKGACRAIYRKDRDKIKKSMRRAAWPHSDIPLGIQIDKLKDTWELWKRGKEKQLRRE